MSKQNELWYAARQTKVVYMPHKLIETFGETVVTYVLVSPLEGAQMRIRTGVIRAARPKIVTPHYLASQALENFGEDARKYFEDVLSRKEGMAILQYGLAFSKESRMEEVVSGNVLEEAERLAKEAEDDLNEVRGVLIGPDGYWEISLIFFLNTLINQSAPVNAREMANHGLFNVQNGIPYAIRQEIAQDFSSADSLEKADQLGNKLRDYGVFDEYEDRFFQLYSKFLNP